MRYVAICVVVVVVSGLLLLAAAYAEDSARVVKSLNAYDGNGKKVGPVFTFDGLVPYIALKIDSAIVPLGVQADRLAGSQGFLAYAEANCVGQPFMSQSRGLLTSSTIAPPKMTVYVPDNSATPQVFRPPSVYREGVGCVPGAAFVEVVPAVPLVDISDRFSRFVSPFSVR
jgi:hypothetical protein